MEKKRLRFGESGQRSPQHRLIPWNRGGKAIPLFKYFLDDLLHKRVPLATGRAAPQPLSRLLPAVLAEIRSFDFSQCQLSVNSKQLSVDRKTNFMV